MKTKSTVGVKIKSKMINTTTNYELGLNGKLQHREAVQ